MKYFIVTGSSRGIGRALSEKLLSPNHHLFCISRGINYELLSLAESKKVSMDYFDVDLKNVQKIDDIMNQIIQKIDESIIQSIYLVNNAAVVKPVNLKPMLSCYSTSKAGLETFVKSIGIEQGDVKIMGFRPGATDTQMYEESVVTDERANKIKLASTSYAADRILTFLFDRFEHGKVVKGW